MRTMHATADDLRARHRLSAKPYLEFLKVPDMSAGLYQIPAGGEDPQQPHREDEIYVVLRGRCRMTLDDEEIEVQPGDVIYVRKKVEHRFHSIVEDLSALVFFAPAETRKEA